MVAPKNAPGEGIPGMSESLKMEMATSGSMRGNQQQANGIPVLTLANDSLNIRIVGINGAIIGRRTGPYSHFFDKYPYVSGTHAQLKYSINTGWCVVDKHSSNGTKLNQRSLQPDVDMSLSNGDVLTIANINLQVIVR
jgi:pSer/pThr/pTyr-binding forkhead associated (FHA) protein